MKRIVLTFGLISGGILGAMMLATMPFMDTIGFEHGMVVGYTTMVLAFLLVFFGIRSYRDTVGAGKHDFAEGLARYGESDLLCYRAEGPRELQARQEAA